MVNDEAFLRAVRADPADEAPWLIYADWLEERGDPRAALYRHRRLTNSLGMQLVLVPRGSFWMGDRGRQRPVEVAHEFYLGAYPVTQEQWQAVRGGNPSYFSRGGIGNDEVTSIPSTDLRQFPVERVSWDDVQQFLKLLNAREKGSGFAYRFPTEAEWEYACRGAATSPEECAFDFHFAQPTNDLSSRQANCNGNRPAGNAPRGKRLGRPSKVGSYEPNRLGLHDMHGNVWEWCQDDWAAGGPARVMRGGSWRSQASSCRASIRGRAEPAHRDNSVGFRLAAVPSGE
jgi:uncharacterized protein (TIGR02996 family)